MKGGILQRIWNPNNRKERAKDLIIKGLEENQEYQENTKQSERLKPSGDPLHFNILVYGAS